MIKWIWIKRNLSKKWVYLALWWVSNTWNVKLASSIREKTLSPEWIFQFFDRQFTQIHLKFIEVKSVKWLFTTRKHDLTTAIFVINSSYMNIYNELTIHFIVVNQRFFIFINPFLIYYRKKSVVISSLTGSPYSSMMLNTDVNSS